ncbi:hypothetical protein WOLCODRAFT_85527 [Wolfiporia cocos MD-104 SS10]|uniref:Uncharacterized protein n=1 Tax=Wolfiporia cocos (strain MD-104) TaxID=742152 RepID=A0A2H3JHR1_WOLCO|nr:hypothetical protein WOLCODRAFT_85527 [Wolfiporia cocos MD-104 SS10]
MDPYQTYLHTLAQDAEYHSYNSATTALPLAIQTLGNLLCDAFRLPEWVARVRLHCFGSDQGGGSDTLRTIFNLVLNDCTSLRHALAINRAYSRRTPLESFLCLIVRNTLCTTRPQLRVDEDSALALPRYSSGELSLLFHHMKLNIRAPLLVSVSVEIPFNSPALVPQKVHDIGNVYQDDGVTVASDDVLKTSYEPLGEDVSSSHRSRKGTYSDTSRENTVPVDAPPKRVPLTASEWLDQPAGNAANEDPDDDEDAYEDQRSLDELDLHVLDYSPNQPLPAMAMLPIVCMGDEATLPILMMSTLYQRWTWRISEPVIGVSFRRYDSTITCHLGWTGSQCEVGRILPRVHIARMDHLPRIDLADPVHALSVAQFMLRIDEYIWAVQNSASWTILTDPRRWRVDSSMAVEPSCSDDRERVGKWLCDLEGATASKKAIPVSVLSNSDMHAIHIGTAEFFWPEEWDSQVSCLLTSCSLSQMPSVDNNVQGFLEELRVQVETHLNRCDGHRYRITRDGNLSTDELHQVMQLLGGSLSSILHACMQARAKAQSPLHINEAGWRHDLDRLFFDFLSNLAEQSMQTQSINRGGGRPTSDSGNRCNSLERTIHLPRSKTADLSHLSITGNMNHLLGILPRKLSAVDRNLLEDLGWERASWLQRRGRMLSAVAQWCTSDPDKTLYETVLDRAAISPLTGICDTLGSVLIPLPVDEEKLASYCFVAPIGPPTATRSSMLPTYALPTTPEETTGRSNNRRSGQGSSRSAPPQPTSSSRHNVSSPGASDVFRYDFFRAGRTRGLTLHEPSGPRSWLELPLLVVEYKKKDTNHIKAQNQHRLYSTAAARFLESVGITRQPVFGIVSDGPVAMLTTTWVDGEYVHIFEEHTESFDISTAFGAWHYATVLARIAVKYGPKLIQQFKMKREDFIARLNEQTPEMRWRQSHQNYEKRQTANSR